MKKIITFLLTCVLLCALCGHQVWADSVTTETQSGEPSVTSETTETSLPPETTQPSESHTTETTMEESTSNTNSLAETKTTTTTTDSPVVSNHKKVTYDLQNSKYVRTYKAGSEIYPEDFSTMIYYALREGYFTDLQLAPGAQFNTAEKGRKTIDLTAKKPSGETVSLTMPYIVGDFDTQIGANTWNGPTIKVGDKLGIAFFNQSYHQKDLTFSGDAPDTSTAGYQLTFLMGKNSSGETVQIASTYLVMKKEPTITFSNLKWQENSRTVSGKVSTRENTVLEWYDKTNQKVTGTLYSEKNGDFKISLPENPENFVLIAWTAAGDYGEVKKPTNAAIELAADQKKQTEKKTNPQKLPKTAEKHNFSLFSLGLACILLASLRLLQKSPEN